MKSAFLLIAAFFSIMAIGQAQSITGVWRGKVSRGLKHYNLELKLIRNGDSLTGTSYYYTSASHYSRFRVKGYFDISGDIVWWDRELIESRGSKISSPNTTPFRFAADFNCPGNDIMMLDGTAAKPGENGKDHEVHLSKVKEPNFKDEWDEVIEDFPYYAGIPDHIDRIDRGSIVRAAVPPGTGAETTEPALNNPQPSPSLEAAPPKALKESVAAKPVEKNQVPLSVMKPEAPKTIEEKFLERKKLLVTEIPVSGDSIKLGFYDHAEIDGDSITLFLNGKMIYQHILLRAQPFEFTLPVSELADSNEMIMVAENLGSIPPNTSLMIVWINGVRHEARLESTESSSAMIRFTKKKQAQEQAQAGGPKLP
jgi:hypothetical protein